MNNTMASDDRNTEFTGSRNPDSVLHVTFYVRAERDNFKSEKEGKPVFQDEQFVRIMIPGRNDTIIDEPVRHDHIQRFPHQWAVFRNSQAESTQQIGTPVTEWSALTRSRAEELKGQKFYTVEQVAECSDGQIQALGMDANILRQKARAFLKQAQDNALAQSQAAEIERKQKEMDALKASIPNIVNEAVAAAVAAIKAELPKTEVTKTEEKPKRKYTRKAQTEQSPEA